MNFNKSNEYISPTMPHRNASNACRIHSMHVLYNFQLPFYIVSGISMYCIINVNNLLFILPLGDVVSSYYHELILYHGLVSIRK